MLKDKYVKVNGVRLHYVTAGKGPLILFLHGFPEFWYEWKNQLVEFGKDHQAVAPDMRGYNLSDKPAELDQYKIATSGGRRPRSCRPFLAPARNSSWWRTIGAAPWRGRSPSRIRNILSKLVIINAPHPGVFGQLLGIRSRAAEGQPVHADVP